MGGGRLPERGEDAELRPAAIDEKKCTPRRKTGALQPRSLGLRDAVFVRTAERGRGASVIWHLWAKSSG